MITISTTRELARQNGVKACIYGRAGAGKTYLARTAPSPLFVSTEAGLLSLRDVDIPAVEVSTLAEMQELFNWLQGSHESRNYWTVYLDSISEVAEVVLANELAKSKDPRQAYGALLTEVVKLLRQYRDLPMKHVIMVAKQEHHQDEVSKITSYGPSMPGSKLGNAVPYMFDEVFRLGIGQLTTGQEYRFIQTAPDMQHEAKDRSGALDKMEPPDIGFIINKILGV